MLNRHSILIILLVSFMYSQQSLSVRPYSFENELTRQEIPVEILPELNIDLLLEEDNQPGVKPFRYGYRHEINLNTDNSGVWDILENGDAIWFYENGDVKKEVIYNKGLATSTKEYKEIHEHQDITDPLIEKG
ncbi:MAG: hypothetical protein HOG97_04435, partial [Candidatus Marinimicrobia bacterium]|nr:hypothetical protein [Candidatus Neomarinimicrobiota bacterium]